MREKVPMETTGTHPFSNVSYTLATFLSLLSVSFIFYLTFLFFFNVIYNRRWGTTDKRGELTRSINKILQRMECYVMHLQIWGTEKSCRNSFGPPYLLHACKLDVGGHQKCNKSTLILKIKGLFEENSFMKNCGITLERGNS